jgi:hypothetical protein
MESKQVSREELIARGLDPDLDRLIEEAEPMRIDRIGWLEGRMISVSLFVKIWMARIKRFFRS